MCNRQISSLTLSLINIWNTLNQDFVATPPSPNHNTYVVAFADGTKLIIDKQFKHNFETVKYKWVMIKWYRCALYGIFEVKNPKDQFQIDDCWREYRKAQRNKFLGIIINNELHIYIKF